MKMARECFKVSLAKAVSMPAAFLASRFQVFMAGTVCGFEDLRILGDLKI